MEKIFNQIQIQTKTGCNLKCPMCPNSYMTQPKKTMGIKVLTKILNELQGYSGRISLYLMNEPFLDKRLPELIKLVSNKAPRARINISTNGVIPDVEDVNIEGLSDCDVSCYSNYIYDKWKNAPVNRIDMVNYHYPYNNRGGNVKGKFNPPSNIRCERPFTQMYINAFGEAVLCCSDYKFEVIMGDVEKNTLEEIWNGKVYKKYRDTLNKGIRDNLKLCDICSYP